MHMGIICLYIYSLVYASDHLTCVVIANMASGQICLESVLGLIQKCFLTFCDRGCTYSAQ